MTDTRLFLTVTGIVALIFVVVMTILAIVVSRTAPINDQQRVQGTASQFGDTDTVRNNGTAISAATAKTRNESRRSSPINANSARISSADLATTPQSGRGNDSAAHDSNTTMPLDDVFLVSTPEDQPPVNDSVGEFSDEEQLGVDNSSRSDDREREDDAEDEDENEPPERSGDFSIAGQVIDQMGLAVANIQVSIKPRGGRTHETISVRTNRDGGFALDGLAQGDYSVETQNTSVFAGTMQTVRAGTTSLTLVVRRNTRFTLFGRVTNAAGRPLPRVSVSTPGNGASTLSDAQGRYSLTLTFSLEKTAILVFITPGYVEKRGQVDVIDIKRNRHRIDVTMRQAGGFAIQGAVVDEQVNPIVRASVMVTSRANDVHKYVETDEDGQFVVSGLVDASDYLIQVSKNPDFRPWSQSNVNIQQTPTLNITLASKNEGRLWGYVVDRSQTPIAQFGLTASSGDFTKSFTSDAEGFYEISFIANSIFFSNGNSTPKVEIEGPGITTGEDRRLDLVVNVGSNQIVGRIVDTDGNAVANADISLSWSENLGVTKNKVTTGSYSRVDGSFSIDQLGSGRWRIAISAAGYRVYDNTIEPSSNSNLGDIELSR